MRLRRYMLRRQGWGSCSLLLGAVLGIGLAIAFIFYLNGQLRPVLLSLAQAQTSNRITGAINDAVAAQAVSYTDLVTLERDGAGNICALTSNMARANALRSQLLDAALEAVDGVEIEQLEIPIGTLTGFDLFSGRGPDILVRVVSDGQASAAFRNQFGTAGINQTLHQIYFDIAVDVSILLPGEQHNCTVSVQTCVAETVIVGDVPGTYLQVGA